MKINKTFYFIWPLVMGIFIGIGLIIFYNNRKKMQSKFLSPLGLDPKVLASRVASDKPLMGFLPYWTINSAQIPYHLLDWLAYFSVTLNYDGTLKKMDEHNLDMGWYILNSDNAQEIFTNCQKSGVKKMLVVSVFNNEAIDTIVKNEKAKTQAIASIAGLVREFGFEGVNIDFEYNLSYDVTANSQQFADFLKKLKIELSTIDENMIISVDLYANGFIKDFPYQSTIIAQEADYLVLMGYDFHRVNSEKAGPVGPIKSQTSRSINQALDSALRKGIDSQKIILAMPFYGYEWQTTDKNYASDILKNSGAMASYKRVHQLIEEKNLEVKWDFVAMSPWIVYEEDSNIYQIYYENDDSINFKLQLIDQVDLGGGAIWALGYEGENAKIWKVIEKWRKKDN